MLFNFRMSAALQHKLDEWAADEARRYHAAMRKAHCSADQVLTICLQRPLCSDCAAGRPFGWDEPADVTGGASWKEQLEARLGDDVLERVLRELASDEEFAFSCRRCHRSVRPWDGDDLHVETTYLEELDISPRKGTRRVRANKKLGKSVHHLYEEACFACGVASASAPLHIDHIQPRSRGGDATFQNLQPLCEPCGQAKADREVSEQWVCDSQLFGPPSDVIADEGFWGHVI